jgi:hypothetical protein
MISLESMLIFYLHLESKFQLDIIANESGKLLTLVTKGQGQNFDFIFLGRSKFLQIFSA